MKRAFDLTGALALAIILAPLLAVIAIAIVLDSPGTVLAREERVGLQGRRFRLLKFRTTEAGPAGTAARPGTYAAPTRVGRFLRHWQLDELPQLFNVLVGDMSFVGPPAQLPAVAEASGAGKQAVLSARPGLTGPELLRSAETSLASATRSEDRLLGVTRWPLPPDARRAREPSIRADARLLVRTARLAVAVLARRLAPKGEDPGDHDR